MMPTYKSVNDETMYYPSLGLLVEPDATVELPQTTDAAGLVAVDSTTATIAATPKLDVVEVPAEAAAEAPVSTPVEAEPASDGVSA